EAQILLLRHLDRDRLERGEEGRAAQRTAAGAVSAERLRFVADAYLAHLDPCSEFRRQFAHEFAEVDTRISREIEQEARPVERLLDARELHRHPALADAKERKPVRLFLALLV